MKKIGLLLFSIFLIVASGFSQEKTEKKTQQGHTDQNKFRQMKDVLATPNTVHTASELQDMNILSKKLIMLWIFV